ncbi:MAG: UDP-N-acetylmuramate dehydrogenase [Tannerellaceae bacterium]|jgi:UDP-N-acetylmuramate dehydrogenase|nr:UDP-N-acetylmuramate dehydrogenase [Tannerellaceae bacterium]
MTGMRIEEHFPLENYNTFRLPVKTRWFIEYDNEEELLRILHDEYFMECAYMHIGGGSNLLFLNDYNGIILHSAIKGVGMVEETGAAVTLRIGAAEIWDEIVVLALSRGWYGIENLSGIPGECGAAAIQNIGAYGVEIKDVVEAVEAYDRNSCEKHIFSNKDCLYSYRHSRFKDESTGPYIVTHIRIRLSKTPSPALGYGNLEERVSACGIEITPSVVRETILTMRREKLPDPAQYGNAGSFFMNPVITMRHFEALKAAYPGIPSFPAGDNGVKVPAGWLIEQCGFKGKSQGEAGVYHKQALALINLGNASGQDIALLAEDIRSAVAGRFHITLMPEVKYIG